jgi:hypothetical protein
MTKAGDQGRGHRAGVKPGNGQLIKGRGRLGCADLMSTEAGLNPAMDNPTGPQQGRGHNSAAAQAPTSFSQKTGPTGKGCTTVMYFVTGAADCEWVKVRLLNQSYSSEWVVAEVIQGSRGQHKVDCVYG